MDDEPPPDDGTDAGPPCVAFLAPGAAGVALVSTSVAAYSGWLGLPAELAVALVNHLLALGLLLVGATIATVARHRPVRIRETDDPRAARARRETAMEAVQAGLVVLTGVALVVQAAAVFQGLLGGHLPEAAVAVFKDAYLIVLAAFAALLLAAPGLRTTAPGARKPGPVLWVAVAVAAASAAVASATQLGLVPGLQPRHAIFVANAGFATLGAFCIWSCSFPDPFVGFVEQVRELPEMRRSARRRALLIGLVAGGLGLFGAASSTLLADGVGAVDLGDGINLAGAVVTVLGTTLVVFLLGFRIAGRLADPDDGEDRTIDADDLGRDRRLGPDEIRFWATVGGSAALAAGLAILGVLTWAGSSPLPDTLATDLFVFAIMSAVGPYGLYVYLERRRTERIEDKFPDLLRDLTEAKRAGMTLPQAVRSTARSDYGVLTEELEKMAAEISWGVPFSTSLQKLADRIDTPLIDRSVALILEAGRAGGDVGEILEAAARDAREIRIIQRERRMGMQIHVMIIYIAFFVFLTVVAIMGATFIPAMAEAGGSVGGEEIGGTSIAEIDPSEFDRLFFHGAVAQAIGGGLVAGIMGDGYPEAGLKHGFALLVVAYVAFRFVIGV